MGEQYATVALVQFLFGIFCAYWAQTTKRSAWLWFFLGWLFAPITGIVLLAQNSADRAKESASAASKGRPGARGRRYAPFDVAGPLPPAAYVSDRSFGLSPDIIVNRFIKRRTQKGEMKTTLLLTMKASRVSSASGAGATVAQAQEASVGSELARRLDREAQYSGGVMDK